MGINQSSYMKGGRNVRDYPGSHVVEFVSVDGGKTNQQKEKFIPALLIHESTNEDLQELILKKEGPVEVADVIIMNKYPDYFYSDVRGVLGALCSVDPADDEFDWQQAKDEAEGGKFDGELLEVEVFPTGKLFKNGKNAGREIHNARYSPAPE